MRFRRPDPLESSARLAWGFVGAFLISAVGNLFDGSLENDVWFYAFLVLLAVTSSRQSLPAAAYNGVVSGLFFNFFFLSAGQKLAFDTGSDLILELAFVVVGVVACLLGRWIPKGSNKQERVPVPASENQGSEFVWKSTPSAPLDS